MNQDHSPLSHSYAPTIRSLQNPRVKKAVKLRTRSGRRDQARFLIDGIREISRALAEGWPLETIFLLETNQQESTCRKLCEEAIAGGATIQPVTDPVFAKLAFGERNEGILAVAMMQARNLKDLTIADPPLLGILEQVEKPGNLGAVARSADGAGVSGLIFADCVTDWTNPNAIRASMGTLFRLPLATATTAETLTWLQDHRFQIWAARLDSQAVPYHQIDFRQPGAIVLGNEAQGLSERWSVPGVTSIQIPMKGIADSLNVSTAAAVLFYEAWRQRNC
ncbi:rRNA methyltransferase [Planctomycetales bacterium 10988]|nr:rRNA methyltransferase [Planctomycetales bacterium 10988]